jgi:hypothetical protein
MLVHFGSDNRDRHERKTNSRNGFHRSARGYNIHNYQPKQMTVLKVVAYMLGVSGSGWFLYMRVGGWKADALWLTMAGFWLVQMLRACLKLYFEYKDGQIELQEKRARYNKDIFT